jgi:hypothetical protein
VKRRISFKPNQDGQGGQDGHVSLQTILPIFAYGTVFDSELLYTYGARSQGRMLIAMAGLTGHGKKHPG